MVSGRYDPTFWYESPLKCFRKLKDQGVRLKRWSCPAATIHWNSHLSHFPPDSAWDYSCLNP